MLKINARVLGISAFFLFIFSFANFGKVWAEGQKEEQVVQDQKTLKRQRKFRTKKTLAQIRESYREMVSAYKVGRKVYANGRREEVELLLQSEYLPDAYRKRMRRKLRAALKRFGLQEEEGKVAVFSVKKEKVKKKQSSMVRKQKDAPQVIIKDQSLDSNRGEHVLALKTKQPLQKSAGGKGLSSAEQQALTDLDWAAKKAQRLRSRRSAEAGKTEENKNKDIEAAYREGINLYKKEKYSEARAKFLEVEKMSPRYELTRDYLNIIKSEEEISRKARALRSNKKMNRTETIEKSLDRFDNALSAQ